MTSGSLSDPALIVLAGAAGSGKSTWAAARFRVVEVVSSDALRGVLGSGPADLDATQEAFALLDQIVSGRARRRLTTVVDTLGLDDPRRLGYLEVARAAGLPAVLVVLDTPAELCRARNRGRDRPVPAFVLTEQLRRVRRVVDSAGFEGWDEVLVIREGDGPAALQAEHPLPAAEGARPEREHNVASGARAQRSRPQVILQVSRFRWGDDDPTAWLKALAVTADEIGFDGIALMDHLIQIPQVDRAWEPIPEPWVTLGMLAGLDTSLRLGTLVSPVTFRPPGIIAKTIATLDTLSNGRAFCGLGAGWWLREHQAYGLDFPAARERLDQLELTIETLRALWAPGTKAYHGRRAHLPETTCYPRPIGPVPIIVGGSGERRTLQIAASHADGCNVAADERTLGRKIDVLRRHCDAAGRDPDEVEITVLDVPVLGIHRDDAASRVERLRGPMAAASFAARHHAGLPEDHAARYRALADQGVGTVFLALPDLAGAEDLRRCAPLLAGLR